MTAQPISPLSRQVMNDEVIGLDAHLLMQPIGIKWVGNCHSRSAYHCEGNSLEDHNKACHYDRS